MTTRPRSKTTETSIASIEKAFRAGKLRDYRPVPFWFWNGDPTTRDTIVEQLKTFKRHGVVGVMPMPLYGLDIEFASEQWFTAMRFVAQTCKKLNMELWIYDEFHCPSGTCAGKVLRDHPDYNCTAIVAHAYEVPAGKTVRLHLTPSDNLYAELARNKEIYSDGILKVFAKGRGKPIEVSDYSLARDKSDYIFRWKNETSAKKTLHLFVMERGNVPTAATYGTKWASHQPGYLDCLNADACKTFLDYTLGGYESMLQEFLGPVIKGVFTDEPGFAYGVRTGEGISLPYTKGFFEMFARRYGYDLKPRLPELVVDTGDFRKTRSDYWRLVTFLFSENYNRQYADWCEKHGMVYTGHYLAEETLLGSTRVNGDIYEAAKWMQMPGIDILRTDTPYDPQTRHIGRELYHRGHLITAKSLVSTAHARGARRILCEAFGIPPWGVTLRDLKKMHDWLTGLGVNFINDNGWPFSIKGLRIMAGRSFTAPWIDDYRGFADYIARTSYIATCGRAAAEVAVLYPSTTGWSQINRTTIRGAKAGNLDGLASANPEHHRTQRDFLLVNEALVRAHREFDHLFEEPLQTARIREKALEVGEYRYKVIVLPSACVLDKESLHKLERFVSQGGRLVIVGMPPRLAIGQNKSRRLPARTWSHDNVHRVQDVSTQKGEKRFLNTLEALLPAPARITGDAADRVQLSHRTCDDGHMLFLVNHAEQDNRVTLSLALTGRCEIWNPDTGRAAHVPCLRLERGRRLADLNMKPRESVLMVVRGDKKEGSRAPRKTTRGKRTRVPGPWEFALHSDNLLLLDTSIAYDYTGAGLDRNWKTGKGGPWHKVKDGKGPLPCAPEFMKAYWLKGHFTADKLPRSLKLYFDDEMPCRLFVNGREVRTPRTAELWDPENLCFNIKRAVRPGRNLVVMRVQPSPYMSRRVTGQGIALMKPDYALPIVVAGGFKVNGPHSITPHDGKDSLRTGSWHTQGYPYYAGAATYRKTVCFKSAGAPIFLSLQGMRDVVSLRVNGADAGTRAWEPYRFEVTRHVKPGRNVLEFEVRNTFGNILRRLYRGWDHDIYPAGLLGPCVLETG